MQLGNGCEGAFASGPLWENVGVRSLPAEETESLTAGQSGSS